MAKNSKERGKIREFLRKRVVALKRKPQTIPFLVLIVGFIFYTLNLTPISFTTSRVKNGTGLSAFITLLASTLALVTFLRTYPRRQKTKIAMLLFTVLLLAVTVVSDFWYHNLIVNAVTKPGNAYVYNDANIDADARSMIVSRAKKIDEDNAQSVLDAITGKDKNDKDIILEDKLTELVNNGTIDTSAQLPEGMEDTPENRLSVFYEKDRKTGEPKLKSVRGVQIAVRNTFTDMRDSLKADGAADLTSETLDLAKLRTVIAAGTLGIRHQVFAEDGTVDPSSFNAAYKDINGKPMFYDMSCHSVRDDYLRVSVKDKEVAHNYADRVLLITRGENGSLVATLDGQTDGTYVRIVLDEAARTAFGAELTVMLPPESYRVDKLKEVSADKDAMDTLLSLLRDGGGEIRGVYDSASGAIVLEKVDGLYMDQVKGRENFEGSGTLTLTMDYRVHLEAASRVYRIGSDYGAFAQAHRVLLVHMILQLIGILLMLTKPLYGALIRKINTSIQVEENQDMGTIDISGED